MKSSSSYHVAIIGGGVSGSLVATHLLRGATGPLRVVLIERGAVAGRGVAYGTEYPDAVLNVPASRMSALPDDPDHFFRWVEARVGRVGFPKTVAKTDFLHRQIYGDYVYAVLKEARDAAPPGVKKPDSTMMPPKRNSQ